MNPVKGSQIEAIGESESFLEFQNQLSLAAKVDRPILIIGERGSGKELAASRLHYLSPRWDAPFLTLNCASLSPSLIESELFGHEAGSFTGAGSRRKGRFEEASEGTLFLDEIGLIPLEVQEKILRVVEYGTFERVGSSRTFEVDVRIIGATNADLPMLCEQGRFKRDLLDRLSFEVLFLPPLRERVEDIQTLSDFFIHRMTRELKLDKTVILSERVREKLMNYNWPGNIRELKNVIERAVYKSRDGLIDEINLNPFDNPFLNTEPRVQQNIKLDQFQDARQKLEMDYLKEALEKYKQNQKEAAEALNLTYDQFRGLYRKYRERLLQ